MKSVKKQLEQKPFKEAEIHKSAGILDDFSIRKATYVREAEISSLNKSQRPLIIHGQTSIASIYGELKPTEDNYFDIGDASYVWNNAFISNVYTAAIEVSGDHTTGDTIYVPNFIHGTDATPPTASNFPIGTIYIQYTA